MVASEERGKPLGGKLPVADDRVDRGQRLNPYLLRGGRRYLGLRRDAFGLGPVFRNELSNSNYHIR